MYRQYEKIIQIILGGCYMKKCCQCRTKIKVKRKDSATNDPISMHSEEFKRIVDTRKERVNIVFKIMYVFAIFFGAIFLEVSRTASLGVTNIYIFESGIAAFLLTMLIYLIIYVIAEMRCIKIDENMVKKSDVIAAENCYDNLFNCLVVSGAVVVSAIAILIEFSKLITTTVLVCIFIGLVILLSVLFGVSGYLKGKGKKVICLINCIFLSLLLVCFFLLPAVNSVVA